MALGAGDAARTRGVGVVAAVALLVALYAAIASRAPNPGAPVPAVSSSACVDKEAREEIEKLHRENATLRDELVGSLEGRVARLEAPASAFAAGVDGGGSVARSAPGATPDRSPRYVRFVAPSPALTIREDEGGAISVTNTDPSLAGKTITVDGVAADGTIHEVRVVVPAP